MSIFKIHCLIVPSEVCTLPIAGRTKWPLMKALFSTLSEDPLGVSGNSLFYYVSSMEGRPEKNSNLGDPRSRKIMLFLEYLNKITNNICF